MKKSWLLLLLSIFLVSSVLAAEECYYSYSSPYSYIKYTDNGAGSNTAYSVYWVGTQIKSASVSTANFSFTEDKRLVVGGYAYWSSSLRDRSSNNAFYEVCRMPVVSSCSASKFDWDQMQASDICDNGVSLNTFTNGNTPCREPSSPVYTNGVLITASTCTDNYKKQQMTLNCIFSLSNNSYEFNSKFITRDTSVKLSGGTGDFIVNGEVCHVLNSGYTYSSFYDCTTPQNTCHIPNSLAGTKILGNVSGKEYFSGFMVNMTCGGVNKQYRWVTGYALFNDSTRAIKWNPVSESNAQAFFGYNVTKFYNQVCTEQNVYNFGGIYVCSSGGCSSCSSSNPISNSCGCPSGYASYTMVANLFTSDPRSKICLGNSSTTPVAYLGGMYAIAAPTYGIVAINNPITKDVTCPQGYNNSTATVRSSGSNGTYCYTTDLTLKPAMVDFGGTFIGSSDSNPVTGGYTCPARFSNATVANTTYGPLTLCYQPFICGNGILEGMESCDDGNSFNGDGCDNNCKISQQYFLDSDGDGFGNNSNFTFAPTMPAGYVVDGTDCDDSNKSVNPGAVEVCDGIDNNCDGIIDSFNNVSLCNSYSANLSFLNMDGANISSADLNDDVVLFFGNDTQGVNYNVSLYKNDTTVSWVRNFSSNKSFVVWKANVSGNYFFKITSNNGVSWKVSSNIFVNTNANDIAPYVEVNNKDNLNLNFSVGANVGFSQFTHDVDDLLGLNWTFGDGLSYGINNYSYFEKAYNNSVFGNVAHTYSSKGIYHVCLTAKENDLDSSDSDCLSLVIFGPGINVVPVITSPRNLQPSGSQWIYFNASQTYVVNCSTTVIPNYNFTTIDGGLYCKYIHAPGANRTSAAYDLTFNWNMGDGRATVGDLDNNYNTAVVFKYKYETAGLHSVSLNVKYVGQ